MYGFGVPVLKIFHYSFLSNALLLQQKDPCTGSNINVLSVLVHITDPILLGLRFVGLVLALLLQQVHSACAPCSIRHITAEVGASVLRAAVAEELAEGHGDMGPRELAHMSKV